MFLRKQGELKEILLSHFVLEDRNGKILQRLGPSDDFELKYCKDYPVRESTIGWSEEKEKAPVSTLTPSAKRTKDRYMTNMQAGGAVIALDLYRDQVRYGFKLVANEVHKQRRGDTKSLNGDAQMEHCVALLVNHGLDQAAIQSVLHFAYDSELFDNGANETRKEREEDDTQETQYVNDAVNPGKEGQYRGDFAFYEE